jgi:hypothetical protein
MDPATAGTVGFLIRLTTIIVVFAVALRIAGLRTGTLLAGGAFTAVVLGLAAQVSASGGAFVACALVHRGLPAELAIPFLALGSLPVRRTPAVRLLVGVVVALAAALAGAAMLARLQLLREAADATAQVFASATLPVLTQMADAPLRTLCAAAVVAIGILLAFRSGVRGWFAPLRHADPREAAAHDHAPAGAS